MVVFMEFIISKKKLYLITLIIYLVCLPLNAMNIGAFGSALKVIALLPIFLAFSTLTIRYNELLKAQTIFTLFAGVSIIWSFSVDSSVGRVISYVELLALLYSGSSFEYTENELKKVKISLAWASRFTAIVMLRYAVYYKGRLRLMGIIKEDPNYLCAYFAFGAIVALQKLVDGDKIWMKITGILEIVLYFYLTLVSGSRGGLIAILGGMVAYFLISLGKKDIKKSIGLILAFIIIVVVFTKLINYLPAALQARFSIADVASDGGSGRIEIWSNGWDLYSKSSIFRWIFGFGTATTRYCFEYFKYSQVNVMHNMFLETLLELGVVGLGLYCLAIGKFVKCAAFLKDKFAFAVIICMVIMSLSTSIYTFKPYFNIMLFIVMSCYEQGADFMKKNENMISGDQL
jgi:hypothetical protein